MKKRITVYGSLLKGLGNSGLLANDESILLGEHVIEDNLTMISLGGFPGLIITPEQTSKIHVETYEVSDMVFRRVEHLEGFPTFYNRKSVSTPYGESEVYVLANASRYSEDRLVPADENGVINWRKYRMR
jgi:gamma-glutamylcyclotransferase (GGCT)/AIG2-like uncharacterized protein YtfP